VVAYCCSAAELADAVVDAFHFFPYVLKPQWAQTYLFFSDDVVDRDEFARDVSDSDDLARPYYSTWWAAADCVIFNQDIF
jgi:hypothetical protein